MKLKFIISFIIVIGFSAFVIFILWTKLKNDERNRLIFISKNYEVVNAEIIKQDRRTIQISYNVSNKSYSGTVNTDCYNCEKYSKGKIIKIKYSKDNPEIFISESETNQ